MTRLKLLLISLFFAVSGAIGLSVIARAAVNPFDDTCASFTDTSGTVADNAPSVCKENAVDTKKTTADLNPLSGSGGIFLRAAKLITFITGIASIIIIILSAIKYIIAGGDSNSINSAKNTLLYAVIGLIIALVAQGIIVFVVKALK